MAKKSTQLDIDLSGIQDQKTKNALEALLRYVNNLITIGLDTGGQIKSGGFSSKGFAIDSVGNLKATSFSSGLPAAATDEISTGFKHRVFTGSMAPLATRSVTIDGRVFGAIGWSSNLGSATVWHLMTVPPFAGSIGFSQGVASKINIVTIDNVDAVNTNRYNLIIFYAG